MAGRDEVSVIVPVFNGGQYLAEAIESILAQTHRPVEIIIVNDGSTDGSADIAQAYTEREPDLRLVCQQHTGISAARNRGIESAKGDYLAFLDADDLWCAGKLALQLAAFGKYPKAHMIFGHVTQFVSPELSDEQRREIRCPSESMPGYSASTMLIPRDVFYRVGLFDSSICVGEFIEWYVRAMELRLNSIMLTDVLLRRRIHMSNHGRRHRDARTDYARVLKAALDRRRAMGNDDSEKLGRYSK